MKKKNIIWVFGDQHRAQALSCNGDPNVNTPNIDRMAMEGVNFNKAVCGVPLCCPFRGSLLTSKYPHQCVPGHEYQLPPEMPTIANAFKEHNYDTAYFGKWHLDGFKESEGRAAFHHIPKERRGGFDTWIGYDNNNSQYDCWVHGHKKEEDVELYRLPTYETDSLTDLLIDYIKDQGEKQKNGKEANFFASLSVQPPHNPYTAPAEYMEKHNPNTLKLRPNVPDIKSMKEERLPELAGYYAMIENLDWNVGRVREALKDAGLDFDTTIVFFSDHGDMHGSHGQRLKTNPYEESIRIPFIVSGPPTGYDHKIGKSDVLINHVDIAPTSLGLCGIEKPEWMDGTDYSSHYLSNIKNIEAPDSVYLQSVIPAGHRFSIDRPWRGIISNDGWKYVCLENQIWLMFDLNEDPYEQMNLAFNLEYAEKRQQLHRRLKKWIEDTEDVFELVDIKNV